MNAPVGIIEKLDRFIKKYYKNQLLKGLILFSALVVALFLVINISEHFLYFTSTWRATLLFAFIGICLFVFVRLILIPLMKLFNLGKQISYEYAAIIIGKHFPQISDKLLNTLQLQRLAEDKSTIFTNEILMASIDQKVAELKPFRFSFAIDFKINRKYLKFLLPPVLILLFLLVASPSLITGPAYRLIKYSTFFEKPAPFSFLILNKDLQGLQQQDFKLDVKLSGESIPDEVFISTEDGNEYRLSKENMVLFHYNFKNLQKDIRFFFMADGFRSKEYTLRVIPRPMIIDFEMQLNYPSYTGRKPEVVKNAGDATVPCGTSLVWRIKTKDVQSIFMRFDEKGYFLSKANSEMFTHTQMIYTSQTYALSTQNQFVSGTDSLKYSLNVIPDAYPGIEVKEFRDSIYISNLYFRGNITDDYGFNRLLFKYNKINNSQALNEELSKEVPIIKASNKQAFYHYFDLTSLNLQPGEIIEYYFEIWDNDAVKGSKASRSQRLIFKVPGVDEIEKQTEDNNEELKDLMEQTLKDSYQLQKQIENLDKKLIDKPNLNWQERKQLEDLIKKQNQLQLNVEQLKDKLEENNIKESQFKKVDESIIEKQKQLEELFNKVMTNEMKELFRQLQEMLDKLDKNKIDEALDKMKMSNKEIEKELERNLELFKQLELEQRINESIEKLQKLSEEQKKLAEETAKNSEEQEKLQEKQSEINKKFNDITEELNKIEEKNSELETPKDLLNTDSKENEIKQELQNSSESLQNKKNANASKSQKNASDKMKEMANELMEHEQEMENEDNAEDIQALRMLLENLIKTSFNQEELMGKLKATSVGDPKYVKIMERQKNLKDDLKMIEDSLFALSKRQPQIDAIVNREITNINSNAQKSLKSLHDRNTYDAQKWQQYVMTSVNNLALLLAEVLQQMQEQQQSSASCKGGKCKKPGNGPPKSGSMKKLQEELNKRMEALKKQMEGGKNPDGKSGKPGMGISEQFARMAAEQEALRRMMQEYADELKKEGVGQNGNLNEIMKKMEQTEKDLANKIISNETLNRQKEILTRLLESEKAEKERDLDEQRKSEEGKFLNNRNPELFFEYNRLKAKEQELIKTIPVTLAPFYKKKANEYFNNVEL